MKQREIKFRAWSEARKDMVQWEDLSRYDYLSDAILHGTRIVMQFTGLVDENGKEIYEGDILLIPDTYTEPITDDGRGPIEPDNHIAPVIFADESFGVDIQETSDILSNHFYSFRELRGETGLDDIEVIGNIYENPGLITKTEK